MSRALSQGLRARASIVPQDITTLRTGTFVDVSGAQRILAAITVATVAATKKITVQFRQAQDAAGNGAKNLGSPVDKVAPAGGAALDLTVDAKSEQLDPNYSFVSVTLVSDNASAVYGSAMLLLGGNRFNP
ncbi:hypothetical protein C8J36_103530 [Rhizobium sp. PP-F2F-G48]|uniref:hypothetical protein n=1 Tax=Rhizobium sp. PP-F2F-G48 TaxID=2135651 RepID=UPI00104B3A57|nr:hypothetical protein [Rhizobium sp. PP-F2F-G48]TCM56160.1 hypothetical protein C8J36_103530 [Rhizobium sp. PP-F2F-G48]